MNRGFSKIALHPTVVNAKAVPCGLFNAASDAGVMVSLLVPLTETLPPAPNVPKTSTVLSAIQGSSTPSPLSPLRRPVHSIWSAPFASVLYVAVLVGTTHLPEQLRHFSDRPFANVKSVLHVGYPNPLDFVIRLTTGLCHGTRDSRHDTRNTIITRSHELSVLIKHRIAQMEGRNKVVA